MKMIRKIITPHTKEDLVFQLPEEFLNSQIEIIAFPVKEPYSAEAIPKRTFEEAVAFYKKNAVDFSQIKKWKREDLYE